MARVNKWKQFGDAFNAVYNAGTTIGAAIETGGIAMKEYEDEEGNKLTGLELDRAKMDDYADVELKYGDPLKSLKMRTGVETLGQNRIKTDNLDADLKSIRGYRDSAANLNIANTDKINLDTDIRMANKDMEIAFDKSKFAVDTQENIVQKAAKEDDSYLSMLVNENLEASNKAAANAAYFGSDIYKDYLTTKGLADTEENRGRYLQEKINNSVLKNEEFAENYLQNKLLVQRRNLRMNEVALTIAQDPATLTKAKNDLETALNTSFEAVANSKVARQIAENPNVQEFKRQAGLSNAELASLSAQDQVITAQRSLQLNSFISEWSKTANPDDPTSMYKLIEGIKAIDPVRGMKLEKDYKEHELWDITNNSLLMKAKANEALTTKGPEGVRAVLDEFNGDKLGVRLDRGEDGSYQLVETRDVGAGGEGSKQTEVVRIIAQGTDEKSFMQDLNAVLDPASLMEYSMNLADIRYKDALTAFSQAQAKAALAKKPLTMDQWATSVMRDPDASDYDKKMAITYLYKDNEELAKEVFNFATVEKNTKGLSDRDVDPKTGPPVDITGEKTEEERGAASNILSILADPESSVATREKALNSSRNKSLLAKYYPEALYMEEMKNDIAKEFIESYDKGDITLTEEGVTELVKKFTSIADGPKKSGQGSRGDAANKKRAGQLADYLGNNSKVAEVLQIVIGEMRTRIQNMGGLSNAQRRNSDAIKNKNAEVAREIQKLQELIERITR